MRIAVISDIHGNLAALEAVVADLERQGPDLILHGGDLALTGPRPAEVVELICAKGWRGVLGNTDEMLFDTSSRGVQIERAPKLRDWTELLFDVLAPWARERLGNVWMSRLRALPREWREGDLLLNHASPGDLWRAPMPDARDDELDDTYGSQKAGFVVYGHIHRPFVRTLSRFVVANAGSVGLPLDGDWRASYLLIDDAGISIRKVEYDLGRACRDLAQADFPRREWLESVLRNGRFTRPD